MATNIRLKPLNQQVILITGASSGIGLNTTALTRLAAAIAPREATGTESIARGRAPRPRESGPAAFLKSALGSGWGTFRTRRLRARA